jgi:hypothetical protein
LINIREVWPSQRQAVDTVGLLAGDETSARLGQRVPHVLRKPLTQMILGDMVKRAQADVDPAEAAIGELFREPPEDFVATRNALVKRLKAAGERDQAARIAALRRPSVVDWALNTVALTHGDVVAQFLAAATAARKAQAAAVEGRRGADLRGAVGKLRESTGKVARLADDVLVAGGKGTGTQSSVVTSRLAAVATNPVLGEQLRGGRLGSGDAGTEDLFADLEPAAKPTRERRPPPKAKEPVAPPKGGPDERELTRAVTVAERAESSSRAAADRAAARLRRADAEVAEAERRLAKAQKARATASAEHDKLADAAETATRAVSDARARLTRAR